MMTERQVYDAIENRLTEAESQCNHTWFDHNDGVIRGLLWALTGEDPGTRLLSRVQDIYLAMGCKVETVGNHIHYWLPGETEPLICDECGVRCCP